MPLSYSTRKLIIPAILALVGLASAGTVSASEATLRVGKSVSTAFSESPIDVGIQYGLFRKEGLDIDLIAFGGGSKLVQGMISGSIDIGLASIVEMTAVAKGAPLKAVALAATSPAGFVIAVRNDSQIKTVADLKGKKISVTGPHSLTAWLTMDLADAQGWGIQGIQLVDLSPTANDAALRTGAVDGITNDLTTGLEFQQQHQARILVNFGDYFPRFAAGTILASDNVIAKDPQVLRAFLRGWLDTISFIYAHKEAAVPVIAKVTNRSEEMVAKSYDILVPKGFFSRDGHFDATAIAPLADVFAKAGFLPKSTAMTKFYTDEFLPTR